MPATLLPPAPHPVVNVKNVSKSYANVPVFSGISLQIAASEQVAITGDSGVGKSSLLNCIAGLEPWNSGEIEIAGHALGPMHGDARARLRRDQMGFVFQAFHVLPHLTVTDNVALALLLQGRREPQRVKDMLETLGIGALGQRLPHQLSGGQLQRVAIARALIHQPRVLLADEPTGNLDPDTAAQVMHTLTTQCRTHHTALILVTHSETAAAVADRLLHLTTEALLPA